MKSFIIFLIGTVCACFVIPFTVSYFSDYKIWNEVIEHIDEFEIEHISDDGRFVSCNLYDKDSTFVCEVLLYAPFKQASVHKDMTLIANSFNCIKSKKVFNTLYARVPEEQRWKGISKKEEVFNHLKEMDNI